MWYIEIQDITFFLAQSRPRQASERITDKIKKNTEFSHVEKKKPKHCGLL